MRISVKSSKFLKLKNVANILLHNLKQYLKISNFDIVSMLFKRKFIKYKARIWSPKCSYQSLNPRTRSSYGLQICKPSSQYRRYFRCFCF